MTDRRRRERTEPVKHSQLNLRVSAEEKQIIAQRAADAGLDVTSYVRKRCGGRAGDTAVRVPAVELVAIRDLMTVAGRMSNDLHGLYREAKLGEFPGETDLAQACADHRAMLESLMVALGRKP